MDSNRHSKILLDLYYSISSVQPSRIRSSANNFIIDSQMINMHSTFTEIENIYEFEDTRVATLTNRTEALEYE